MGRTLTLIIIMLITVFTPTYNRAYTLSNLYKSLCAQTQKDFEWLVVDDGSFDNTSDLIAGFQKEKIINIKYYKVENGGKHRAINYGVRMASGEAFFIVDSDDILPKDAITTIETYFRNIQDKNDIAGVSGFRMTPNGRKIGGGNYPQIYTDSISIREKYHVKGDMAEVFKTAVLREYPFPSFEGEKFITEEAVWSQIAQKYKLRYFYKGIYCCEYLADGLTKNIRKQHRNSPLGTMYAYRLFMKQRRCLRTKVISAINYWRYTWNYKKTRPSDLRPPFWAYAFYPLGIVFYYIDIRKEK